MRSAEMKEGRVFVLRLEEGEILHEAIESFCVREGIRYATVIAVGAVAPGSRYVCGSRRRKAHWWRMKDPTERRSDCKPPVAVKGKIVPVVHTVQYPSNLAGTGTVFPDDSGAPMLHMHGSFGNGGIPRVGCFRAGMVVWLTMEVVIREMVGEGPVRRASDPRIDAKLLEID